MSRIKETITLDDQIACVRRELAFRRSVYKKRIDAGQMDWDKARREYAAMQAVLLTLESLKPNLFNPNPKKTKP